MNAHTAFWQKTAGLVILLLAGLFVQGQSPSPTPPTATPPTLTPGAPAKPAATVNGEAIPLSELQALLNSRPPAVPLPEPHLRELRKAALDMLIDDLIMRQFLRKHAPPANPADIDKEISTLKDGLAKKMPPQTFAEYLIEGTQTEEQLRGDVAARLQWKGYLTAKIPEAELKSYFEANQIFFEKVFVTASHILVKVGPDPMERAKAREKIDYLRQEIVMGKIAFEEAAQKYSDCPSKEKKGDIGPFPYKFVVVEPFAKTAFSMKVNELSGIVASEFGFHLIKVTKRGDPVPTTFEAARDTVREVYAQDLELYTKILVEQKKLADIKTAQP